MAFKSNFKKILALALGIASFGANSKNNVYAKSQSWIANNPVKSALIGALGLAGIIGAEEIIRRNFFNEKFGYDAEKDCVYKRKSGRVDIVIIGSSADERKQLINDIKNNKKMAGHNGKEYINGDGLTDYLEARLARFGTNHVDSAGCLFVSDERAKISNWNIIEKDLNKDNPDEIANLLKNDVTMAIFIAKEGEEKKIDQIFYKSLVSKVHGFSYFESKQAVVKIDYSDPEHGYKRGAIANGKGLPYHPIGLELGNINGFSKVNDYLKDEILLYDTINKNYAAGHALHYINVLGKFGYPKEEIENRIKKIEENNQKAAKQGQEIKSKVKELISRNKSVDEITKIIRESYKELDIRRSDIEYYAQNKA